MILCQENDNKFYNSIKSRKLFYPCWWPKKIDSLQRKKKQQQQKAKQTNEIRIPNKFRNGLSP